MSIADEIRIYDNAKVSCLTGETESYDDAIFPNVIRRRELELIQQILNSYQPKLILDYGCGGGWLSKILYNLGFRFVGVDVSKSMVQSAKVVCPDVDFLVCDGMRLPFKENVFDFFIGISVLHHLELYDALVELKRTSVVKSAFLFMEPSLLNPFSAFGRKMFPMDAHTKGERPYMPHHFKVALGLAGFWVKRCYYIFFLSFPLARFSRIVHLKSYSFFIKLLYSFELLAEKIPGLRSLNSNMVIVAGIQSVNQTINSVGR